MEYQSGGELFSYLKEEGTFTEVFVILQFVMGSLLTPVYLSVGRHALLPSRNDSCFGASSWTRHHSPVRDFYILRCALMAARPNST